MSLVRFRAALLGGRACGADQLLLMSVSQVERDKVDQVERYADNAKVFQNKVQHVGQVEREQDGDSTQGQLEPGNR